MNSRKDAKIAKTIKRKRSLVLRFSSLEKSLHTPKIPWRSWRLGEKEFEYLTPKYAAQGITVFYSTMTDHTQMTDEQKHGYWFEKRAVCSGGRCNLVVGPDGLVTLCEEAPQTPEFTVGDLKTQSISEVWHSEAVANFTYPRREAFAGTVCEECDRFLDCAHTMGHCFRDSYRIFGRIFAPSPFCPFAPPSKERIY